MFEDPSPDSYPLNQTQDIEKEEWHVSFVKIVESYPELYRPEDANLHVVRLAKWHEVSERVKKELNSDFTPTQLKHKWWSLKGSYREYLKQKIQAKTLSDCPTKYYLADHLQFILPYYKEDFSSACDPQKFESDDNKGENEDSIQRTESESTETDLKQDPTEKKSEPGPTDKSSEHESIKTDFKEQGLSNVNFMKLETVDVEFVKDEPNHQTIDLTEEETVKLKKKRTLVTGTPPSKFNMSDYNYIEEQEMMIKFVKIVEKHPDLYSYKIHRSRNRHDKAWDKVHERVKTELNFDCTLADLKSKWKGIRSTFCRYIGRIIRDQENGFIEITKKYYLADYLHFLVPHLKLQEDVRQSLPPENTENSQSADEETVDSDEAGSRWSNPQVTEINFMDEELDNDNFTNEEQQERNQIDSDVEFIQEEQDTVDLITVQQPVEVEKESFFTEAIFDGEPRPKMVKLTMNSYDESNENEDLQFFKSVLPDIAHFTPQQKRKLKMGILKLIDDIESQHS